MGVAWIKCSEVVPKDKEYVLVSCEGYFEIACYDYEFKCWNEHSEYIEINPTHWTYLPKPPLSDK